MTGQENLLLNSLVLRNQRRRERSILRQKIFFSGIVAGGLSFWWAQLICWGLAEFHVSSGIAGPYLFMLALSGMISSSVALAAMTAYKHVKLDER